MLLAIDPFLDERIVVYSIIFIAGLVSKQACQVEEGRTTKRGTTETGWAGRRQTRRRYQRRKSRRKFSQQKQESI